MIPFLSLTDVLLTLVVLCALCAVGGVLLLLARMTHAGGPQAPVEAPVADVPAPEAPSVVIPA